MKRLLAGSVIYSLGGMANRLVSLLLLPLFTAYMAPSDYGVVAMLIAVGGILSPVFSLGLGSSIGIVYFNTRDSSERQAIMWSAGIVLLSSSVLLVFVGWMLRHSLSRIVLGDDGYGVHTALAIATTAIGVVAMPWQLKLQFEERATAFVITSFCCLAATMGASLWFVVGRNLGALGALSGSLVGQVVGTFILFLIATSKPSAKDLGRWVRALLRHGLPMIPGFFFLFLMQQWVRWPLEWYHGLDAVGVYSVGSSLGSALGILTGAFISAWTPYALSYSDRQDEAVHILGRITFYFIAGFCFVTSLFFLFAEPLVRIFTQPAFYGASQVVGLSAVAQFVSALFLMLLPPLYFAQRADNVVATQAVATAIMFLLAEFLVPMFGVLGAALTVVLGFVSLVIVQWIALRFMPVLRIQYDYPRIGLLLALLACVGVVSFGISFGDPIVGFALAGLVTVAMALIIIFGICTMEDFLHEWKRLSEVRFRTGS